MSEATEPRHEGIDDEALERILSRHAAPTPEVTEAVAELEASREALAAALDELVDATRSALDVPAKVRRNPAKAAALVGGTGFLLAGGPRRVVRFVGRRVLPQPRRDPYAGVLPEEIEQVLRDSGVAKDPEIRRALDKDFADYLKQKGRYGPEPSAAVSFWRTFDKVAGPLGTAAARVLVQRLMEAERSRSARRSGPPSGGRQAGTR